MVISANPECDRNNGELGGKQGNSSKAQGECLQLTLDHSQPILKECGSLAVYLENVPPDGMPVYTYIHCDLTQSGLFTMRATHRPTSSVIYDNQSVEGTSEFY